MMTNEEIMAALGSVFNKASWPHTRKSLHELSIAIRWLTIEWLIGRIISLTREDDPHTTPLFAGLNLYYDLTKATKSPAASTLTQPSRPLPN